MGHPWIAGYVGCAFYWNNQNMDCVKTLDYFCLYFWQTYRVVPSLCQKGLCFLGWWQIVSSCQKGQKQQTSSVIWCNMRQKLRKFWKKKKIIQGNSRHNYRVVIFWYFWSFPTAFLVDISCFILYYETVLNHIMLLSGLYGMGYLQTGLFIPVVYEKVFLLFF